MAGEAEVIAFQSAESFERWLDDNAGLQPGVWLRIAKKASGIASIISDE